MRTAWHVLKSSSSLVVRSGAWYSAHMALNGVAIMHGCKQILLAISIVYFYGLAFAFQFDLPRYHADHPIVFLGVGALFCFALLLEIRMTWWHRRRRIFWGVMGLCCYAVLGFVIAPLLYGEQILWIPLVLPLAVVFVLGFLYVYARLIHRAFFSRMKLSIDAVLVALKGLPGWELLADGLEKTFRFSSYAEAITFLQESIVVSRTHHRELELALTRRTVKIRIFTPDVGVTQTDLDLAKALNEQ